MTLAGAGTQRTECALLHVEMHNLIRFLLFSQLQVLPFGGRRPLLNHTALSDSAQGDRAFIFLPPLKNGRVRAATACSDSRRPGLLPLKTKPLAEFSQARRSLSTFFFFLSLKLLNATLAIIGLCNCLTFNVYGNVLQLIYM